MMVSKAKTAPDIYGEREMKGPEWDEPKDVEVAALYRTGAVQEILATDPKIKGWKVVDTAGVLRAHAAVGNHVLEARAQRAAVVRSCRRELANDTLDYGFLYFPRWSCHCDVLPEARLHFDVDNRGGAGSVSSLRHRVDLHHAVAEVHWIRV